MFSENVLSPQQCSPCAFSSILIRSFSFKSRGYSSSRSNHWQIFLKIGVLKNFAIFTWKHLCWSLYLKTLEAWWPATLLKKRLQHRCFLVNIAKFLRTAFFIEHFTGCFWGKFCRFLSMFFSYKVLIASLDSKFSESTFKDQSLAKNL